MSENTSIRKKNVTLPSKLVTLQRHIMEEESLHPEASGEFTRLLWDLTLAFKIISREVNKAGLINILGKTGETNVQGEEVQKLDEYANDVIVKAMDHGGHLCVMASEEVDDPIRIPSHHTEGDYVLLFDPLDGSSNIDVNVSIGTIFSIHKRISNGEDGYLTDCLQKGTDQVAAGYVIYGSSTVLVYSTGAGVHGFTLDPSVGEFLLSHENITCPKRGQIYSINEGNAHTWDEATRAYVESLKTGNNPTGKPYKSRYIGSLVADFHRNLLNGGIFLYPADMRDPDNPKPKLRLLYEGTPLAYILQQAGGLATTGTERILDIEPTELHQRVPLVIGSEEDVLEYEAYVREKVAATS
jgi:fructose-1,6-bisphosphatase I